MRASPAAVSASLSPSLKTVIAMFCIALALLYATASAASVVDRVQHQGQSAHHHQHGALSDLSFDDHHQDGDHGQPAATDLAGDPDAGTGHHHHADGPQGIVGLTQAYGVVRGGAGARLAAATDDLIAGPAYPGPERPPKARMIGI